MKTIKVLKKMVFGTLEISKLTVYYYKKSGLEKTTISSTDYSKFTLLDLNTNIMSKPKLVGEVNTVPVGTYWLYAYEIYEDGYEEIIKTDRAVTITANESTYIPAILYGIEVKAPA